MEVTLLKELIPMDEYGLFADAKDTARVDSRYVAEVFGKRHDNVLRDIEKFLAPDSGWEPEFNLLNFAEIKYTDNKGRKQKAYALSRDGFMALVMGYNGKKAVQIKQAYIRRFNEMETFIRTLADARREFPLLTDAVKLNIENPQSYHYSNEIDMINRLAIGKTAKQFRIEHGIPKGESIRPYLTTEQLARIERLQIADVGLLAAVPDYAERRLLLERQLEKLEAARAVSGEKSMQICRDRKPSQTAPSYRG